LILKKYDIKCTNWPEYQPSEKVCCDRLKDKKKEEIESKENCLSAICLISQRINRERATALYEAENQEHFVNISLQI